MTDRLPHNLLALFQPRPPLRYMPPNDYAPEDRKTTKIDGVASFLPALQEQQEQFKDYPYTESWLEKRDRETREKRERQAWLVTEGVKQLYKPQEDKHIQGDAYTTLFVGRLPYDLHERELEDAFGKYGKIQRIRIVRDCGENSKKKGKSRGYAFIVFETNDELKRAYDRTQNASIRNKTVVVDVERGRTTANWRPRRFGGGFGGRHYTKQPPPSTRFGGHGGPQGYRDGGFRGDFDRGRGRGRGRGGGGGGFRGGFRGGYGGPPDGAPAGPRQGGGYGGDRDRDRGYGGRRYDDRGGSGNANFEPIPSRGGGGGYGGGYRDRDRDSSAGQKRSYDGGYDDPRQRRRY